MSGSEATASSRIIAGRYQLGARLGTGAASTVFEAVDTLLERKVAVKMLAPALVNSPGALERFREHAKVLSTLNHPNVVAVSDWGTEQIKGVTVPFVVTEHLAGGTLREMIDRGRRLSASQALVVGLDSCRGLDHLHRKGLVHGEVTPGNLFFGADRRLKISDVGFATLLTETTGRTAESMELAAARYASPEQALDQALDGKTDVYSLTICLIEAVTGEIPFQGDTTVATLGNRVDKLLPVSADLGPLASVFERGGRPRAADRSSAAEFGRALVQAAEKLPKPAPLPLVGLPSALFEAPPGSETTSELTRFKDPTGALASAPLAGADASGAVLRDPTGTVRRDATGAVRRTLEPTAEPAKPRVISIGTDATGAIEASEMRTQMPSLARINLAYVVIAVGLVAAAILGYIAFDKFANPSFTVPSLVGQNLGEAQNSIQKNGWNVVTESQNSDEQPIAGVIFKTEPVAGVKLEEGKTFTIFVSKGPTLPKLPESANLTAAAAVAELSRLGLRPTQTVEFSETVPRGTVVRWSVPRQPALKAGAEVVKNIEVALVVSQGPEPRKVPDVSALNAEQFEAALAELGLVGERGDDVFSNATPAGNVAATQPTPGESIERGGVVAYQVSKGPDLIVVPSLSGTLAEVEKRLRDAGFEPVIEGRDTATFVGVSINDKPAAPGDKFPRGTEALLILF